MVGETMLWSDLSARTEITPLFYFAAKSNSGTERPFIERKAVSPRLVITDGHYMLDKKFCVLSDS